MTSDSPLPAHYMYAYGCSYTNTAKLQQQAELKKSIVNKVSHAVPVPQVNAVKKVSSPVVTKNNQAIAVPMQPVKSVPQPIVGTVDWNVDADQWLDDTLASQYNDINIKDEYYNDDVQYDAPVYKTIDDSYKPLLIQQDTYVELHRDTADIRQQMYDRLHVTKPISNTRARSMGDIDDRSGVPHSHTIAISTRKQTKYYNSVDAGHKFMDSIIENEKQSVWFSRSAENHSDQDGAFDFEL